jgi:hypothetical protein
MQIRIFKALATVAELDLRSRGWHLPDLLCAFWLLRERHHHHHDHHPHRNRRHPFDRIAFGLVGGALTRQFGGERPDKRQREALVPESFVHQKERQR